VRVDEKTHHFAIPRRVVDRGIPTDPGQRLAELKRHLVEQTHRHLLDRCAFPGRQRRIEADSILGQYACRHRQDHHAAFDRPSVGRHGNGSARPGDPGHRGARHDWKIFGEG
jgi:hypothetical protein